MTEYTLKIEQDPDPVSPREREWDNLGIITIAKEDRNSGLGDETFCAADFEGWDDIRANLLKEGALIVCPLYLFDHSGIVLSIDADRFRAQDSHGWDWGQIGFIYITKERVNALGTSREDWFPALQGEIDEMNQWLSGDVWGYSIMKEGKSHVKIRGMSVPLDDMVESCWGFFGRKEAVSEGMSMLQSLIDEDE